MRKASKRRNAASNPRPNILGDQTMKQIAAYPNAEYGVESRIYQTDKGFNVALFDTDADERVCLLMRFQTLAQAVVKAKHLANV